MKTWSLIVVVLAAIVGFAWFEWQPWIKADIEVQSQVSTGSVSAASGLDSSGSTVLSDSMVNHASPNPLAQTRVINHREIRAKLNPVNFTNIAAEIEAKVADLPFKEGMGFDRGDVLIRFDCDLQQAKLDKVQAELEIAKRNFSANAKLAQRGSVSRLDAQNSESELNKTEAQVRELTILISKCVVPAPYTGKVVDSKIRREQFVQVGQPLMEILDDSRLELEFIVPSVWLRWLKPGYEFEVFVDETALDYRAKIERIGARIDPVSQTIKVVGAIEGTHQELMAGMSGSVKINPPEANNSP